MTEDQLEHETLTWLQDVGYAVRSGFDIAPDGPNPERAKYNEVLIPRPISGQLRLHDIPTPIPTEVSA